MAKKLFVGNIPYAMTDDQLLGVFSPIGKVVAANIVKDKFSQRSKGYGFVEYETEEEAAKAIETLNGSDQGGRNIVVKEALPRPETNSEQPQANVA
jgi:RNA recognition motif-containing protein